MGRKLLFLPIFAPKVFFKSFGGIYPCQGQTFSEILYFNITLKVYYCCKRGSCLPTGGGVVLVVPGNYIAYNKVIQYGNFVSKIVLPAYQLCTVQGWTFSAILK